MFRDVVFEITGKCNAKCKYCYTGNKETDFRNAFKHVNIGEFEKAIDHLLEINAIKKNYTRVALFNWGEPFLHQNFDDIIDILNDRDLFFTLSTNCSIEKSFKPNSMKNLQGITFSIPGFSQSSQDKMHGFNHNKIKANMIKLTDDLKIAGFTGKPSMSFHVYQFNLGEINEANEFCLQHRITGGDFLMAYMNDYDMSKKYLEKNLSYEALNSVSKELILYYVDDLIDKQPLDYSCSQWDFPVIDENCNLVTCCVISKDNADYSIGSIHSFKSVSQILERKKKVPECGTCMKLGLAYWAHNPQTISAFATVHNEKTLPSKENFLKPWLRKRISFEKRQAIKNTFGLLK